MKEIVNAKYHNDFNKLSLRGFTELQQNILFGVMIAVKDQKETITLSPAQIKDFTNKNLTAQELWNEVVALKKNLFKLDFTVIKPLENKTFLEETYNLFKKFLLFYSTPDNELDNPDKRLEHIDIKINEEFAYLINELTANFTKFELAEFIAISGKYTKNLYTRLKQFRKTGILKMEWQEFLRVMDIPENYRQIDIDQRILKPAIKELTKPRNLFDQERIPFENLTYTKIKGKGRGRGGNVIGIEFSFKPQKVEDEYILTKNQKIEILERENQELTKEVFENNLTKSQNEELKERNAELEKIAYGVGLYAYCGLKYYSPKKETLRVIAFDEIPNSSTNEKYKAEILNEKTNKTFWIYIESPKQLMNIISKNEADLVIHNQEIIKARFSKIS